MGDQGIDYATVPYL